MCILIELLPNIYDMVPVGSLKLGRCGTIRVLHNHNLKMNAENGAVGLSCL